MPRPVWFVKLEIREDGPETRFREVKGHFKDGKAAGGSRVPFRWTYLFLKTPTHPSRPSSDVPFSVS